MKIELTNSSMFRGNDIWYRIHIVLASSAIGR